ncbi:hypothetical protein EDB83DRAFT_2321659 [Lactarius deliciosus]|nr:hypothetical protein EDB83DRAFT_2321659 [Lactarius deliciosus]
MSGMSAVRQNQPVAIRLDHTSRSQGCGLGHCPAKSEARAMGRQKLGQQHPWEQLSTAGFGWHPAFEPGRQITTAECPEYGPEAPPSEGVTPQSLKASDGSSEGTHNDDDNADGGREGTDDGNEGAGGSSEDPERAARAVTRMRQGQRAAKDAEWQWTGRREWQ